MLKNIGIPKGTRDFAPEVMQKREYIFDTLKSVFKLFGYQPLETPSMENLSTLLEKYGAEGDKLIFRIINSGDFLSSVPENIFQQPRDHKKFSACISDKGLRYDLTVPLARFVVMNYNKLNLPFKRYQIQPVWRADRPQKGRYREFYQCDVDIIGTKSILNEFELVLIIDKVFQKLNIDVVIHINNRKMLDGILQTFGIENKLTSVAVVIDKLDNLGRENVISELSSMNIPVDTAGKIIDFVSYKDIPVKVLEKVKNVASNVQSGADGFEELSELNEYITKAQINAKVIYDLSLARGLDYYTGTTFEVKADSIKIGSVCGGGRYDDLTSSFGLPDISATGISFGADRIYDVMNELNIFPENLLSSVQVLFLNFGKNEINYILPHINSLREKNFSAELYPDTDRVKKQMNYANKKNIPFVVIAGENEIKTNSVIVKNMQTGEQKNIKIEKLLSFLFYASYDTPNNKHFIEDSI